MINSIIKKFMDEHSLFNGVTIVRGLYLKSGAEEIFVFEGREWKHKRTTFVFSFDCGVFYSCKTEVNTMEKYLEGISNFDRAEYVTF